MNGTLSRQPLGQRLIRRGLLDAQQLASALEAQNDARQRLLGEILVERQLCTDEQVVESLAESYGVPFVRLTPKLADPAIVGLLPRGFLERNAVVPLFRVEGILTLAMADPANLYVIEEVERRTGSRVQVVAASLADLRATLDAYLSDEKLFVVEDGVEEHAGEGFSISTPPNPPPEVSDPPVVRLVNNCLFTAARDGATDIHIEPAEQELRIRFRIDGRLTERFRPPSRMRDAIAARLKWLAALDRQQHRLPQEGTLAMTAGGKPWTLRVSTVPGRHGETIVIHLLEEQRLAPRLEKLGFGYETLKQWKRLISRPSGLVLVCGPSGSGKREALYASLSERRDPSLNLCSIEDPVDQTLPGVNQFPVDERAGFTFASAARALLRQEPDVLMISWLKDAETARLAAQAALTGRLVMTALHAIDAPSAVARLLHLGVEPYIAGATFAGALSLRQVRRLCPACKEPHEPTPQQKRQLEHFVGPIERLFRPRGCDRCHGLGFAGRLGLHELLVPDEPLLERLTTGLTLPDLRALASQGGLRPLRTDGLEKVKSGLTTLDEVYRVTG